VTTSPSPPRTGEKVPQADEGVSLASGTSPHPAPRRHPLPASGARGNHGADFRSTNASQNHLLGNRERRIVCSIRQRGNNFAMLAALV